MDKHVYIATYCTWTSFGSVLQAFSLCSYLKELGYDAQIIDYDFSDIVSKTRNHSVMKTVKNLMFFFQDRKSMRGTKEFIEKNVPKLKGISKYDDLSGLIKDGNIFLAGSDQIWHPDSCNPFFFLRFVKGIKRISYAASMGKTYISKEKFPVFSEYIMDFDYISVREKDACDIINKIVKGRAVCHVDPTFLHDSAFWEKYEKTCKIHKKYILLYPLFWDKTYNEDLKKIAQEEDVDIIAISKSLNIFCTKRMASVDLGQFLYLIHHAEAVVTSSFHGMALSLNYHKDLCVVVNPSMPSRFSSLMNTFDLKNIRAVDKIRFVPVDYDSFENKRRYEQERAKEYLMQAIGESL